MPAHLEVLRWTAEGLPFAGSRRSPGQARPCCAMRTSWAQGASPDRGGVVVDCSERSHQERASSNAQVYVMESGNVREGLWPVQKRTNNVQYFLEHHNGFFYILTNAPLENIETSAEGYYLARCRAEKSLMDRWQVSPPSEIRFFSNVYQFVNTNILFVNIESYLIKS